MTTKIPTSFNRAQFVAQFNKSRVRKDNAPQNMAMLRHVALNLLKADTSTKVGIKTRRKMAGWSNEYLAHLLGVKGMYQPRAKKQPRAARN
jgi:hypothetical protein